MLIRLRIVDLALIEDAVIEFGAGLNVLTGETGAGKSVVVGSIGLVLGGRASATVIREGAEKAVVEALFTEDDREWVVRREVWRDRTNRCYLDGALATARTLRQRAEGRIAIHGQHEDQRLLAAATQREILDAFAGVADLARHVADTARRLERIDRERVESEARQAEREARLEFLRSQIEELEAARLEPGEEKDLEVETRRLQHSIERVGLAFEAQTALAGDEGSVVELLGRLEHRLGRLGELDPELSVPGRRIVEIRYELQELATDLERYAATVEHDPARLAELESRADLLYRLQRKHACRTVEELIQRAREMGKEVAALEGEVEHGRSLEAERRHAHAQLVELATALAETRDTAAERLEGAVLVRLADLGMGDGMFRVRLERAPAPDGVPYAGARYAWTRGGLERVSFLIAPNTGEPPRPLAEIASGGELSRTLLALEAALAETDHTPTLVFDEVDAGIGGAAARLVAQQLDEVARHHQVIVVTHLAAIAAVAHRHLVVDKSVVDGRSVTAVRAVNGEERVREVSRLLGGDPERDVSRHHAERLLEEAR